MPQVWDICVSIRYRMAAGDCRRYTNIFNQNERVEQLHVFAVCVHESVVHSNAFASIIRTSGIINICVNNWTTAQRTTWYKLKFYFYSSLSFYRSFVYKLWMHEFDLMTTTTSTAKRTIESNINKYVTDRHIHVCLQTNAAIAEEAHLWIDFVWWLIFNDLMSISPFNATDGFVSYRLLYRWIEFVLSDYDCHHIPTEYGVECRFIKMLIPVFSSLSAQSRVRITQIEWGYLNSPTPSSMPQFMYEIQR